MKKKMGSLPLDDEIFSRALLEAGLEASRTYLQTAVGVEVAKVWTSVEVRASSILL